MLTFNNTEVAFAWRSNNDLKRARFLFRSIRWPLLVRIGNFFLQLALFIRFPIAWVVRPTIYKHFVGGETIEKCLPVINLLASYNVKSILDYSVEGKNTETSYQAAYKEILHSVKNAANHQEITFSVFKPTGLIHTDILTKVSEGLTLSQLEQEIFNLFIDRVDKLCAVAKELDVPILIDAEDSWYQQALDDIAQKMMQQYNTQKAIVYNTLQMYRVDRLGFLKQIHKHALDNGYKLGVKFVRGAYMEKERARAKRKGYPSPIHPNKMETDKAFNQAQRYAFENIHMTSIFCGTHNEQSVALLVELMQKSGLKPKDERVTFSQLYGMSDNISFILAKQGFNAAKYIPYGPVRDVMPYLLRRAQENTSVKGQTGRELALINEEFIRRRSLQK